MKKSGTITCLNPRCGFSWEVEAKEGQPFPNQCTKCKGTRLSLTNVLRYIQDDEPVKTPVKK